MHRFIKNTIFPILLASTGLTTHAQDQDSVLLSIGYEQYKAAVYDSAIINLNEARKLLSLTEKHQDHVYAILYLGKSYGRLANFAQAQHYFDMGLAIALDKLGEHNDATIRLYEAMDYNYGGQAKYKEALQSALKALDLKIDMSGKEHKSIIASYNSIAFNLRMTGNYDSALILYQNALDLSKQIFDNYLLEGGTSKTLAGMGWLLGAKGEYAEALKNYKKAYDISTHTNGKEHPSTLQKLKMMGWCAMQMGDYASALEYSLETARIRMIKLGKDHPNMATAYHDLGRTYMLLGEYDKAIAYQQRGNTIWSSKFGDYNSQMANFHNSLGLSYKHKGDYQKALDQYVLAERVALKSLGKNHLELANTYQFMADIYHLEKRNAEEFRYLQKALKISVDYTGPGHLNAAMIHRKMGKHYSATDDHKSAMHYYTKSLKSFELNYKSKHPIIARTLSDIGDHYFTRNTIDSSLYYYQKALIQLSETFVDPRINNNPTAEDIRWEIDAIKVLNKKAIAFFDRNKEPKFTLKTFNLALTLIDQVKQEFISESARADLYERAHHVYNGLISICSQMYEKTNDEQYLSLAFETSEKSKSMVLFEVHNTSKAQAFANVPDSTIERERQLKLEVSNWKDKLFKSTQRQDTAQMKLASETLFFLQNRHDNFVKTLETTNPEYHALKYSNPEARVPAIQKNMLDSKSAMIEYFIGDSNIYSFAISKSKVEMFVTPKPREFDRIVNDYRRSLTDFDFIINSPAQADRMYAQNATLLYKHLVQQPLEAMGNVSNLIIVPDGVLWHVNFQTLLSSPLDSDTNIDYRSLNYLIKDYSINFAHSASILTAVGKTTLKSQVSFAGFAPGYGSPPVLDNADTVNHGMLTLLVRDGELPLPGALNEVKSIAALMNGTSFIEDKATENNFKNQAHAYDVLHLAMHSLLNDEHPAYTELVFDLSDSLDDGYLSISEIYNLKLNAEMVVLSACNSGYGKIQNGEGPISLSRAFNYAGCPSVVMSLWKIPDNVTEHVMVSFYKFLKKGYTKNEGLRKAQLAHLNGTEDPLYQHPYFWSGFLTIGDSKPINTETKASMPVLILIITMAFLAALYSIELRNNRT